MRALAAEARRRAEQRRAITEQLRRRAVAACRAALRAQARAEQLLERANRRAFASRAG